MGDPQIKRPLREATEAAHARGVFGVPTVAVGDELFWGDDRLEAAAAYARFPSGPRRSLGRNPNMPRPPRSTSAPRADTRARAGRGGARVAASGTRWSSRSAIRGRPRGAVGEVGRAGRAAARPVALRDVAAAERERLTTGHRGARQRARRRDRARVARADRRIAGHRQVDADHDGARERARRRPPHPVRVRGGVGGADPAPSRAPARRRARHPGDRRDRSRDGARRARAGAARGVRDRLGADAPLDGADERGRVGRPGPRGRGRADARGEGAQRSRCCSSGT